MFHGNPDQLRVSTTGFYYSSLLMYVETSLRFVHRSETWPPIADVESPLFACSSGWHNIIIAQADELRRALRAVTSHDVNETSGTPDRAIYHAVLVSLRSLSL
jgi:hypothetical protein